MAKQDNKNTLNVDLTLVELASMMEDKVNIQLDKLSEFKHQFIMAAVNKTDKRDAMMFNMRKIALELSPVLYFVKSQAPKYGELLEALLKDE